MRRDAVHAGPDARQCCQPQSFLISFGLQSLPFFFEIAPHSLQTKLPAFGVFLRASLSWHNDPIRPPRGRNAPGAGARKNRLHPPRQRRASRMLRDNDLHRKNEERQDVPSFGRARQKADLPPESPQRAFEYQIGL